MQGGLQIDEINEINPSPWILQSFLLWILTSSDALCELKVTPDY